MWRSLFAFFLGALLPFAFAPFNFYILSYLAPAGLLYLWISSTTPKAAFWRGWVFGLSLFGAGASWIYISIHQFGNVGVFIAGFITLLFVMVMALYYGALGYLLRRCFVERSIVLTCFVAFPLLWVFFEWLRSYLFGGFPWLFLGYSQMNTPLQYLAPIVGVYGLSFLTALSAGALIILSSAQAPYRKCISVLLIIVPVILGWSLQHKRWTHPTGKPLSVAIVQANVTQQMKWQPEQLFRILKTYQTLTQAHWQSALIVWPEAAIPAFPSQLGFFFTEMNQEAKQHQSTLILGAPTENPNTKRYYNTLLVLGHSHGHYLKRHLVPFGEYTPLGPFFSKIMQLMQVPMSNFSKGPKAQPSLFIQNIPFAPFICYEAAFPITAIHAIKHTQLIINISDDGWFGHSIALAQQVQMTQMRALETGRYAVVAANTGISGIINPEGQLIHTAPIDTQTVITGKVQPMTGNTPLMRWLY